MRNIHWIKKTHLFRADEYICSVCGATAARPEQTCPSCRAAMGRTRYDPTWVDEAEGLSSMMDDDW